MHIHYEQLTDVARYIENHAQVDFQDQKPTIENILRNIRKYKEITQATRILEIGVGSGWFQIYCRQQGLDIRGLEISPQLKEFAMEVGRKYDTELSLEVGNIEETEIGDSVYDCIVASSVFEHVEDWQRGVKKIYDALKPGGLFYFDSTNKFSFTSGEYDFPLYGWMPDSWRFRLRRARQGEDIMKLGIDFHQFTYPQLRRFFKDVGFKQVMDLVDFKEADGIRTGGPLKKVVFSSMKRAKPLKHLLLTFVPATIFICLK
ncbi:MAG: 2-polyprenyl-6-hydroxyphenyl methylase / 3-demethylubiquinone-9 3-methyltransferase [Blastocatellia bacterium]|jgi:SAM-dependent methyltransferase|nr:2-polyprenyl-6-hydroxyphenyl methylase / 3-demethylubiquinone-9 3-methyltransferase [Blastocatellia bacterium]